MQLFLELDGTPPTSDDPETFDYYVKNTMIFSYLVNVN